MAERARPRSVEVVPAPDPLRVFVFPRAERALVVYVPETVDSVELPRLAVPFTMRDVSAVLGDRARVSEGEPGRWSPTIHQARNAARAARGGELHPKALGGECFRRGSEIDLSEWRREAGLEGK